MKHFILFNRSVSAIYSPDQFDITCAYFGLELEIKNGYFFIKNVLLSVTFCYRIEADFPRDQIKLK